MRKGAIQLGARLRLVGALIILAIPTLALGQGPEVHGENSIFVSQDVAIVWSVLKGATEEQTQVIARIAPRGGPFAAVRIEGVDPFTQNRQVFIDGISTEPRPTGRHARPP